MSESERLAHLEPAKVDPWPSEESASSANTSSESAAPPPSEHVEESSREPEAGLAQTKQEDTPTSTTEASKPPEPAAAPPTAIEPPVPSGPYRTPPHEVQAPIPRPPTRPYLGSAVATFGPMLWSFVVAGQFTTSWSTGKPLAQGSAAGVVLVTTLLALVVSVQRSHHASPAANKAALFGRSIVIAIASFALFVVAIVAATAFGASNPKSHDFLIGFGLVALAVTSTIAGPRLTTSEPPARTHGQKFMSAATWVLASLATLAAGIDLGTNG